MRGIWLLLVLAAALVPALASGEVYRWVDADGTLHYASGLERVPERYRGKAELVPASPAPDPPPVPAPVSAATRIAFTPGHPILVSARIGGAGPVTLVLDTGADRTLVAPSALQALGIGGSAAGRAEITGVTGSAHADVIWVTSIEVEQARVGPLAVIAHDPGLGMAQGLLGRDFLGQFRVTIDSQKGVVTLLPPR